MDAFGIYSLKLYDRKPDDMPLDRLADYLREFALILGKENQPVFSSINESSVLLCAKISGHKQSHVDKRLLDAQRGDTQSGVSKHLIRLEAMMLDDHISKAEFLNPQQHVLISLQAANEPVLYSVSQSGEVDGEITGVMGADDTMHITLKEWGGRIVKLITGVQTGRELGHHLRMGIVRLYAHGQWNRTDAGWKPDPKKCFVDRFDVLDESGIVEIFNELRAIPGNGWATEPDPLALWRELRGIEGQGLMHDRSQ